MTFGDLCAEHEIAALPTIQLYKEGERIETVRGGQEYEQFKGFVAERIKDVEPTLEEKEEEKIQPTGKQDDDPQDEVSVNVNPEGLSADLDGPRLNEIIASKKPWFIKFYSPSCPHCVHLAPTWTKMASELRNQVDVAEVNCQSKPCKFLMIIMRFYISYLCYLYIVVCEEQGIEGFPTMRMYGQGDKPLEYRGDRSLISLVNYAKANAG
jgi:thioredoxin-like negative regulator of GroEL